MATLTRIVIPIREQCLTGGLTGAVASTKVTEAPKKVPQNGWNHSQSGKGIRGELRSSRDA